MTLWIGILLTMVYFSIGTFIAELVADDGSEPSIWVLLLWPIIFVGGLVMYLIFRLPTELAKWVKKQIEEIEE